MKNEHENHKSYVQKKLNKIRDVIKESDCLKRFPSKMNISDIATRGSHPLLLSNSDLLFFGIEFSYSSSSEWPNLQAGDNFTFPNTPNHNLVNDACFSNVTACILCANFNNFNEASSGLFETGKNVTDINNLVNPSARLTSTSYAYDNPVDASTCLTSASTKVNVNISNVININKYSSLNNLLCITCWVMKAKAKFVGKINKNKKGVSDQRNNQ